ncbi:MAG: hypothetical protein V1645_02925 [archaeon]
MTAHKITLYAKLEELYSSDIRLNKRIVEDSVKSGLEAALRKIEKDPIEIEFLRWKGETIMEITGGFYGCDYARALYELGIEVIPVIYDEKRVYTDGHFDEVKGYTPRKLNEVPLLEEEEYKEYYRIMDEYGYPIVLSSEDLN